MKAVIAKKELLSHKKHLKVIKLSKKLIEASHVTISVSEKFLVTAPGFSTELDCAAESWGTVSLPFRLWQNIVENLVPALKDKEIAIAAETFCLTINETRIEHPHIKVTHLDKVAPEIPVDAKPIEIVEFALRSDMRALRGSVSWKTVKTAIDQVRDQIKRARAPLRRYGVTEEELTLLVARKRGIRDHRRFMDILFGNR
ncbi:hypothetical protein ACFL9T_21570 [Thermodesulfobacteriota bacterium]